MAVDTPPTVADKAVYWSRDPAALLAELRSGAQGLASTEALRRLQQEGPNAIDEEPAVGIARLLLRQFTSPLVLILVFGGVVSAALRDWLDAAIILAVVLGSSGLGFLQEYRASNAVAQLRSRLALTARVLRDGRRRVVPTRELVPGDVVELSAGNLVPADGLVLDARDFLVSEASLTGESFPVEKQPGVLPAATPLARRTNAVHLGTSVRSGTATVLVVHTGEHTAFGAVAERLRTRGTRDRVRARRAAVRHAARAGDGGDGAVRADRQSVAGATVDRVDAVRRRPRRRPVARTAARHRQRDAVGGGAPDGASAASSCATSRRSRTSAAWTCCAPTRPARSPLAR